MTWTAETTTGFTAAQRVALNEAQAVLERAHPDLDPKTIGDTLTNEWSETTQTAAGLVAAFYAAQGRTFAAQQLGRATSPAKARAARANGKRGGRPRTRPEE